MSKAQKTQQSNQLPSGFPFPDIDFVPTATVVTISHLVAGDRRVVSLSFDDGDHRQTKLQLRNLADEELISLREIDDYLWEIYSTEDAVSILAIGSDGD